MAANYSLLVNYAFSNQTKIRPTQTAILKQPTQFYVNKLKEIL